MNQAVLFHFQDLARTLAGNEPQDWQWIGKYMSQRHFGITEKKAKAYAERHGGIASKMEQGS